MEAFEKSMDYLKKKINIQEDREYKKLYFEYQK